MQDNFVRRVSDLETFKKIEERVVKQYLDIILLKVIGDKHWNGYKLHLYLRKFFLESISPGSVYHTLHSLERSGLLKAYFLTGSRYYFLTEEGRETLQAFIEMKERILKQINFIL